MITLYSGKDLDVRYLEGSDRLLVGFSHVTNEDAPVEVAFGERILGKLGRASGLFFVSRWNHWWQTREMEHGLAAIERSGVLEGRSAIMAYGSSMGGYGALLYGARLKASSVLSIAPQISIDPKRSGPDQRFRGRGRTLTFVNDRLIEEASRTAKTILVYDPRHREDRWNAEQIEAGLPHAQPIHLPVTGHPPTMFMLQAGMLVDFVAHVFATGDAPPDWRARRRAGRRGSRDYWRCLAAKARKRGWHALADRAEEEHAELVKQMPQPVQPAAAPPKRALEAAVTMT
ncbi:hypothetical protein [Prosthecomicrobium pneumaticum]|uniref:Alpha/beta hydrolase n=1 Tax=Prosthecomicrobium pneumaticum TaxID=81895 RepID=A0A7W9FKR2_9HYPH|nr:hypothetical protein [Prosthecomicrobium pneumaticum]MBB5751348.1 hypothetical protein [Prosthecomicrobium pneumaticum]